MKPRQNSPAIPLINGEAKHRGLVPSRPQLGAPEGSLDGWPRCHTMQKEGNGRYTASRAIGHFYFAE